MIPNAVPCGGLEAYQSIESDLREPIFVGENAENL